MGEVVRIEGLREFQKKLKEADGNSQKELRLVFNDAADLVVSGAKQTIPVRTGRAASTVKAQSSQRQARVKAGSAKVPYYGWLDFGGSVGIHNSVKRPFIKDGRYLYPTFQANKGNVLDRLERGLEQLITKAGLA